MNPSWPKAFSTPHDVVLNSKSWGKGRGIVGDIWGYGIFFPLLSWKYLNTILPVGSSEWIPYFALFECEAFALPFKLSFCTFTFLISPPSSLGKSGWVAVWGSVHQRFQQDSEVLVLIFLQGNCNPCSIYLKLPMCISMQNCPRGKCTILSGQSCKLSFHPSF